MNQIQFRSRSGVPWLTRSLRSGMALKAAFLGVASAMTSLPAVAAPETFTICSREGSEFDFNGGYVRGGDVTSGMRAKLQNPFYFGVGGSVAPEIPAFSTLSIVDATTLSGCNVYIGGGFEEGGTGGFDLVVDEANALKAWSDLGGDRFVIGGCDRETNRTCTVFGRSLTGIVNATITVDGALANNPLSCGGGGSPATFGGASTDIGTLTGDSVLATHDLATSFGEPAVTTDSLVNPTIMFTADADMYGSSGNATINDNPTADNDQAIFVLNSFKFAFDSMQGRLANPSCYTSYNIKTDLALSLVTGTTAVALNDTTTLTLAVDNQSGETTDAILVSAPIPSGFTFVSASGGTYDVSTGVWDVGTLAGSGSTSLTLTIRRTATTPDPVTFFGEIIRASLADIDSAPNSTFGAAFDDHQDGIADDDEVETQLTGAAPPPSPDVPFAACQAPDFTGIAPDGLEDLSFPRGYWAASYYEGRDGVAGSTAHGSPNPAGGPIFRGEAFWGTGENPVPILPNGSAASGRWSNTETPTSPLLPHPSYVGDVWTDSNPTYQIDYRRNVELDGVIRFGGNPTDVVDDNVEVFVNGTRQYAYFPSGGAPDPRPGPTVTATIPVSANDDVLIRFANLGSIGGLSFEFISPGYDCSDAPAAYNTASHEASAGTLRLGDVVDIDSADLASADATGDAGDDDGITTFPTLAAGDTSYTLTPGDFNAGSGSGTLYAWIDFNGDDVFDANEFASSPAVNGVPTGNLSFSGFGATMNAGTTYARFRLTTDTLTAADFATAASDGEVEDYAVTVTAAPSVPFTCDARLYQSISVPSANDPSQLYSVSVSGSTQTNSLVGNTAHGIGYNATGYNTLDNYIYGIERTAAGDTLVQVDANGNAVRLGTLDTAMGSQPGAGDMDNSGNLYVRVGGSQNLFKIDVATRQVTATPSDMTKFSVADFAFNPVDGLLYAMSSNTGQLMSLNPSTGAVTDIGPARPELTLYGAQFFDSQGNLYGLENATGDLYRFDITDGSYVLIATGGTPASGNDGASCRGGPLGDVDYSDAAGYDDTFHVLESGIRLGATIDADAGPLANADASGDGPDDDGVIGFPALVTIDASYSINAIATNGTGSTATLHGWIDFDGNGTFDADEHASSSVADGANADTITLSWSSLPGIVAGTTFARIRLTTDGLTNADATTAANDGEVEDYRITIYSGPRDTVRRPAQCGGFTSDGWITDAAPGLHDNDIVFGSGDPANDPYAFLPMRRTANGQIETFFGPTDESLTGFVPTRAGTNLIATNRFDPNNRSEYHLNVFRVDGEPGTTEDVLYNTISGAEYSGYWLEDSSGAVIGAADFVYTWSNGGGVGESISIPVTYPADGIVYMHVGIFDPTVNYGIPTLPNYICPKDYGDAPLSYGNPSHPIVQGVHLGANVTSEAGPYDSANASGDSDDGVTVPVTIAIGSTAIFTVDVTGSTAGLSAWIDFDGSGTFDGPAEQVANDVLDNDGDGTIELNVFVPEWSVQGQSFARFRWSNDFSVGPDGAAFDGEVEDYAITLGNGGTVLSGQVFLDTGAGGGTAHDAVLNGTEVGTPNATVEIFETAGNTLIATGALDGAGNWTARLPDGFMGDVRVTTTPAAGLRAISEQTAGLPGVVNADPNDGTFVFTPVAGIGYSGIDFGLIAEPLLSQDQVASLSPGQTALLPHTYVATTTASVQFSLAGVTSNPADAFSTTLFEDTGCDGAPDTVISGSRAVTPGETVCLLARTQASNGIGASANATYSIQAVTTFANTTVTSTLSNTDAINGGTTGEMVLRKLVRNTSETGSQETTQNSGAIGDVLQYRIIMSNPGVGPAANLSVFDRTPVYTALSAPIVSPVSVASGVTCTLVVPAAGSNTVGYQGALEWSCPGQFAPGETGAVTFDVTILP